MLHVSETPDGKVRVGDWVAFLRAGRIVYARVDYLRRNHTLMSEYEVVTTEGAVSADSLLEVRAQLDATDAAALGVYRRELERIYREHPELKRAAEDMGEEITTP